MSSLSNHDPGSSKQKLHFELGLATSAFTNLAKIHSLFDHIWLALKLFQNAIIVDK